jgi:tetratricopeptide (TPR) repeat protein
MKTRALAVALALLAGVAAAADLPGEKETTTAVPAAQRGDVFVARRSWDSARDAYLDALRATAPLHNKLGICYQHLKDYGRARAEYAKALELRPDYPEVWNNLGTLNHTQGAYDQAVAAYQKAIALDHDDALIHKNLGLAWLAQDDVAKALGAWSEALRLDPAVLTTSDTGSVPAASNDLARQYYLFAKLIAARGDVASALELLGLAREHGFRDFATVEHDPDFAAVVQDPRWAGFSR